MFMHIEKAYNKFLREVLCRCPEARGLLLAYIRVVKDIHNGSKMYVRIVRGDSMYYPLEMGFHQGSTLNLFFFFMVILVLTWCIHDEVTPCMLF